MSTRVKALFGFVTLARGGRARRLLDGRRRRARRWRSSRRCCTRAIARAATASMGAAMPEIKKTMPNVRDFHDPAFRARASTDTIVSVMMAGKGQMPAFASSLSLPKMQALSGYVRRLGTASAPPGAAP